MGRRGWTGHAAPLLGLMLALMASPAASQARNPHGGGPRPRALHARAAEADALALCSVETSSEGRLSVRCEPALLGELPGAFAVKRSPLRPPPLEPGDRAVLLLRGARPPYVLVDEPHEVIRLEDQATARLWGHALAEIVARLDDPAALALAYGAWLDEGPRTLREAAAGSLVDPALDTPEVHAALAPGRARAVADTSLPNEVRQLSALLAGRSPEGSALLIRDLDGARADPAIVVLTLRAGATHRTPGTREAFRTALAHPERDVRLAALRSAGPIEASLGDEATQAVAHTAEHDPDAGVREVAERVLEALERDDPHVR